MSTDRQDHVGAMRCKDCRGDIFSVSDLEDQTPIICDQCGATVGKWADVRALAHIPQRKVLDETGTDVFTAGYRGIAEISFVGVD
jgi:hypothetical protein